MKKHLLTSVALLVGPVALFAQTAARNTNVDYVANPIITPQFFIAVIAGVLLALGFQFILTALSVAAGITAVGDLKERYVESKYDTDSKDTFTDDDDSDDDDDGMSTGKKVTTGFGIWSVVTACISLFGATALAINLSLISSTIISITLGLVIWATFFILLFYLESKLVNTLIGGLINTATAGLRASGHAVKEVASSAFGSSKESQMRHVAEDTVDKIRKDLRSSFDPSVINDTIDDFFKRFDKNVPDYDKVKKDIQEIVEQSNKQQGKIEKENIKEKQDQKQSNSGGGQGKWLAISQVISNAIQNSDGKNGSPEDKDKVEKLKKLQKELKAAYDEGGTNEEKLEKVAAKLTPADEEQIHSYVEKIKGMLSQASPDDMEKEEFKDKIMGVVQDPKGQANKLAASVGDIDRETIVNALTENTALTRDQIEKYADKVEDILRQIADKFKSLTGGGGESGETGDMSEIKKQVELAIFQFMNHTGKPELDTSMLTSLFKSKLDDGKDSLKVVKRRLQNLDQESVKAMVLNNTGLEQSHIDKVVQSIEEAKTGVMDKITEVETAANRKIENMKRKAVIEAEHARQNAAAAAWWVVASAILSAGAAIGGSLIALG